MCLPCPAALPARGVTHSSLCEAKKATRPNHQIIAPNDGAPSTKKRGERQFLHICARKGFSEAPAFPPKPPEDPLKVPDNPTHPASFLRQFSPRHSPVARPFRGKKGLFRPNARRTRPRKAPERPVLPRRRPAFARPGPGKRPAWPGFARDPGARAHPPAPRKRPRVRLFAPIAPVFSRRAPPSARRNPARQARRPAKAHPWGWQTRLPWSAFPLRRGEACAPRGDQISEIRWLETAAHSRVKFREIRGPGYLPQKWIKRRDWR